MRRRPNRAVGWSILACIVLTLMLCFAIIAMPTLEKARTRELSKRGCSTITNVDRDGRVCEWGKPRIHLKEDPG